MSRVVLSWVQPIHDLACAYLHVYESDEAPQPIEDTERHGWVLRGPRDDSLGDPACFRIQFPDYTGEAERKAALAQARDVAVRVGVDLEIIGEPRPSPLEQALQQGGTAWTLGTAVDLRETAQVLTGEVLRLRLTQTRQARRFGRERDRLRAALLEGGADGVQQMKSLPEDWQPLVQAIYDAVGRAAMHALRKEDNDE